MKIELFNWDREKLPFEIPDFAKKYENLAIKKKKTTEKFATFCGKNCQIWPIKFTNWRNFSVPGGPEYYIDIKIHRKSYSSVYQKEKNIKNINLIPKRPQKTTMIDSLF